MKEIICAEALGTSRTQAVFVVSHADFFLTGFFKDVSELLASKVYLLWPHLASAVRAYVLSLLLLAGADAATQTPCCMVRQGLGPKSPRGMDQVPFPSLREMYGVSIGPCFFSLLPLLSALSALGNHNLSLPLLYRWPFLGGLTGGGVVSFYISCCL